MPSSARIGLTIDDSDAPWRVMKLFSTKWTSAVLHTLFHWPDGGCRTGELQRALPGISKKMLIQTLRDMEHRGLLRRHVYKFVPPKVEYELTSLGVIFAEPIEMLYAWGKSNKLALDRLDAEISCKDG
jgi:DNA-binding HxlR family transcriptional regulator